MPGLALVDYDNLVEPPTQDEAAAEAHTRQLVEAVVVGFSAVFREVRVLEVRLYGGWIDERGRLSPVAVGLDALLPTLRRRMRGISVRPAIATSLLRHPNFVLRGTVRLRARPRRQKMVDGMLGCDAVVAVETGVEQVGVVTNDDDLVPSLLSAQHSSSGAPIWLRSDGPGVGLNDRLLARCGVRIQPLARTFRARSR